MSVHDHADLRDQLADAMNTYAASADTGEDRRRYYDERDDLFAEAERRDAWRRRRAELETLRQLHDAAANARTTDELDHWLAEINKRVAK